MASRIENTISAQATELDEAEPTSPYLPHGYIRFLENIGLGDALEIPHPYPLPITTSILEKADRKGPKYVQKMMYHALSHT